MAILTAAQRTAQIDKITNEWIEIDHRPEEVLWCIYWIAARSEAPADYNQHIYRLLSEVEDEWA